jgi:RNA polymerase sigma-70 factor (ECF subfamily)
MQDESEDTQDLLGDLRRGAPQALERLWLRYRKQLLGLVAFRLDARLRRSVSISEVLQEVHGDAVKHLSRLLTDPEVPFFIWLRTLTVRRLIEIHRQHLGAGTRDADEGAALGASAPLEASPEKIAAYLEYLTRPGQVAPRYEAIARLREHFNQLDPLDRKLLALRLFEVWDENEAAAVLEIDPAVACTRYALVVEVYKEAAKLLPASQDWEDLD